MVTTQHMVKRKLLVIKRKNEELTMIVIAVKSKLSITHTV